jgi:hypothetical protein
MNPAPVSYTFPGCNGNGTCPERPDVEATGYLEGSVAVDDAGHVVHVDISGMTFSKRHLKVTGLTRA